MPEKKKNPDITGTYKKIKDLPNKSKAFYVEGIDPQTKKKEKGYLPDFSAGQNNPFFIKWLSGLANVIMMPLTAWLNRKKK